MTEYDLLMVMWGTVAFLIYISLYLLLRGKVMAKNFEMKLFSLTILPVLLVGALFNPNMSIEKRIICVVLIILVTMFNYHFYYKHLLYGREKCDEKKV